MATPSAKWAQRALILPGPLKGLWLAGRRKHLDGRTIDAHAQVLGEYLDAMRPPGYEPTPAEARQQLRRMIAVADLPGPALARREDLTIPGPAGDIPARLYAPEGVSDDAMPLLVYLHGGGWVIGDLDAYDNVCAKLATWGRCLVVSVDYRLAPEHPFPAAPEDCIAAYRWLADNAGSLGGDPARLAVAGDSAGGNLSAVVAQAMARDGEPLPKLQVLIYPGLDMHRTSASHRQLTDAYVLSKDRIDWFMAQYLRAPTDADDVRASPILADDLAGQPPAYIVACGFDPLRDEALAYAERLRQAGVAVELRDFPGQVHGFTFLTRLIPEGTTCLQEIGAALQRAWAR